MTTVEGLANGRLSALQASFLAHGAAQCGICTPALLVAATALLDKKPNPTEAEVQDALGGILCRCTGYRKIIAAVMDASLQAASLDFRLPQSGHAVGSSPIRLDGVPKVTGGEKFGGDSFPADALAVLVVRSPHYHAGFAFGDLDGWAKTHPGIVGVFTAADIPGKNCFGVIGPFADQPALAEGFARLSRRGGGAGRRRARGDPRSRPVGFPGPLDRAAAFSAALRSAGRRCGADP